MKPFKLNLSRFHKIAEDNKTSTFKHHDNDHKITIAHSALPRDMRSYLKSIPLYSDESDPEQSNENMSKGGNINSGSAAQWQMPVKKNRGAPKKMQEALKKRVNYASGDTDVSPSDELPIDINNSTQISPEQLEQNQKQLLSQLFDKQQENIDNSQYGTTNAQYGSTAQLPQNTQVPDGNIPSDDTPSRDPASTTDQSAPSASDSPDLSNVQTELTQLQKPTSPDTSQGQNQFASPVENPTILGGYSHLVQGAQEQAQGEQQLANAEVAARKVQQDALLKYQQYSKEQYAALNTERQKMVDDANNSKVDPSKYWHDHSKVLSGLGLIIAGFNPTNKPNAAIAFLNDNMNRDIDAQKQNLSSKQSLLAHNIAQFGNLRDAQVVSRANLSDQLSNYLEIAKAKNSNPFIQAKMNQYIGTLQGQTAKELTPLMMRQAILKTAQNGTSPIPLLPMLQASSDPADQQYAKNIQEKWVPSIGLADKPVPQPVIDDITAKQNLINLTGNLRNYINNNFLAGKWITPQASGVANTMAGEVHQWYRNAAHASTSEGESQNINDIVGSNPSGFLSKFLNDPKLRTLESTMNDSLNTIKHNYYAPNNPIWANQKSSATEQPSQQIKYMNGKPFVQKGNRMVPVNQ